MTSTDERRSSTSSSTRTLAPDQRRALIAAGVGHFVEYYDYTVYGFVAASVATNFFPSSDPTAAMLSTFAAFALAFVARPIGGLVFGHFGDRLGRRGVLAASVLLMGAGSLVIGIAPTYAAVGAAAPAILVLARLIQGFSAGGENSGAASFLLEYAPRSRRGFFTSIQMTALMAAMIFGSGAVALLRTIMSPEAFDSWGWRIPFLLGAAIALVGLYLRLRLEDTPAFRRIETTEVVARIPLAVTLTRHWREVLICAGFYTSSSVASYILLVFMPTYSAAEFGVSKSQALYSNTVALALLMILVPFVGAWSDRIGRKKPLIIFNAGLALAALPLIQFMSQGGLIRVVVAQLVFAVISAFFFGAGTAAAGELFPTRVRYTGLSLGNNAATALFGGTAPFIATWLIASTGSAVSPAFLLIASALVTLTVVVPMRETSHAELRDNS